MAPAANVDMFEYAATATLAVPSKTVSTKAFRLDAGAFMLEEDKGHQAALASAEHSLAEIADVFTVYIQTPLLEYVRPFAHSRPYLTTSELGEYQRGEPTHVSLLTDPRLIGWEITRNTIVLSRSGRVGETYWVDKKLAGALVGDSFRVVAHSKEEAYFVYALLSSTYARNYISGVTYGSVVEHASVDQVRSLPVPAVPARARARIAELISTALQHRETAYDLLDSADSDIHRVNSLSQTLTTKPHPFDPLGRPECHTVNAKAVAGTKNDGSEIRIDAHFYNPTAQQAVANIRKCREVKTVGEVTTQVMMGPRFKRNYVSAEHGVPFLSGKNIVQIRPTDLNHLSNLQMAEMPDLVVKREWILVSCSGTIGRTCFVWDNYEDYAASQHVLRVIPDETEIDPGYLYAFLSSHYGYEQILRFRHGSVIDEVTDKQMAQVLVPIPSKKDQTAIGDKVREAYEKRAEALRLEDEAQAILAKELTRNSGSKGV